MAWTMPDPPAEALTQVAACGGGAYGAGAALTAGRTELRLMAAGGGGARPRGPRRPHLPGSGSALGADQPSDTAPGGHRRPEAWGRPRDWVQGTRARKAVVSPACTCSGAVTETPMRLGPGSHQPVAPLRKVLEEARAQDPLPRGPHSAGVMRAAGPRPGLGHAQVCTPLRGALTPSGVHTPARGSDTLRCTPCARAHSEGTGATWTNKTRRPVRAAAVRTPKAKPPAPPPRPDELGPPPTRATREGRAVVRRARGAASATGTRCRPLQPRAPGNSSGDTIWGPPAEPQAPGMGDPGRGPRRRGRAGAGARGTGPPPAPGPLRAENGGSRVRTQTGPGTCTHRGAQASRCPQGGAGGRAAPVASRPRGPRSPPVLGGARGCPGPGGGGAEVVGPLPRASCCRDPPAGARSTADVTSWHRPMRCSPVCP
uniref:translation initiation factor IF-2-like n=1 Tax=Nyctereutes procyonoides TaxID=34880 RepID=UPI0024444FE7|nr:translation initiation factor IF-2-like [Nyctereutes procyonoides]